MAKKATLLLVLFLAASSIVSVLSVKGEAKTIIVPDDYPTIQSAVKAASTGDTVFVRKGNYDGPIAQTVFINKTLSLVGEEAENTKINLHMMHLPVRCETTVSL